MVVSLGLSCRYKRFFVYLNCFSRPSTKYFFLTVYYSILVPLPLSPSKLGRQTCWGGRQSLSVYLWLPLTSTVFLSQEQTLYVFYLNKNKVKCVAVYACRHDVLKILEALTVPFGGPVRSLTFFEDFVRLLAGRLIGEDPALLADLGIVFHRNQSCNIASFVR